VFYISTLRYRVLPIRISSRAFQIVGTSLYRDSLMVVSAPRYAFGSQPSIYGAATVRTNHFAPLRYLSVPDLSLFGGTPADQLLHEASLLENTQRRYYCLSASGYGKAPETKEGLVCYKYSRDCRGPKNRNAAPVGAVQDRAQVSKKGSAPPSGPRKPDAAERTWFAVG